MYFHFLLGQSKLQPEASTSKIQGLFPLPGNRFQKPPLLVTCDELFLIYVYRRNPQPAIMSNLAFVFKYRTRKRCLTQKLWKTNYWNICPNMSTQIHCTAFDTDKIAPVTQKMCKRPSIGSDSVCTTQSTTSTWRDYKRSNWTAVTEQSRNPAVRIRCSISPQDSL